jgi:cytochrome P450 family 110
MRGCWRILGRSYEPVVKQITDVELRDELLTLLLAGHETTATALSWALYWMQAQPEVLAQLRSELAALPGDNDAMAITKLPYLNAFCSEVLRIYPIALIVSPRQLHQPMALSDLHFEAGALLAPCIYLTHRRPDLYPNPEVFRPERFLERSFSPSEYFPFGGSNRRCIGAAFALFEMKLVLARIIQRLDLQLAEPGPVRPSRRGVTVAPKGGVRLRVQALL